MNIPKPPKSNEMSNIVDMSLQISEIESEHGKDAWRFLRRLWSPIHIYAEVTLDGITLSRTRPENPKGDLYGGLPPFLQRIKRDEELKPLRKSFVEITKQEWQFIAMHADGSRPMGLRKEIVQFLDSLDAPFSRLIFSTSPSNSGKLFLYASVIR